jgi:hypothetical protein
MRWLLIGEITFLPGELSTLVTLEGVDHQQANAAISGEVVNLNPELSGELIRMLLDLHFQVFYTPLHLPNLLVENSRVSEIQGSLLREVRGVDSRSIVSDFMWSLSRRYFKISGTVESIEKRESGEIWIRLRDSFGYRNAILTQGRNVKIGESLMVIGSYPFGVDDFPCLEAIIVERDQIGQSGA